MYIGYTPEHERAAARAPGLLRQPADARAGARAGRTARASARCPRSVVLQMAADGWLGIGWPKEYGGQGRGFIDQFIFFDESMRAGAPVPMLTINSVAPTIMKYGSQEQKDFFLPKILAGEIHFCIGYTEPDAGTDLASLKSRAERDGDEWVINGQKIFTSLATDADYVWLAVRTNPEASTPQGHLDDHRADRHARLQGRADPELRQLQHQLHVLRGRAGALRQRRQGRGPGLAAHHGAAQPRAGHAVLVGDHGAGARRRAPLRPGDDAGRRPPPGRRAVGAAQPGLGARPGRRAAHA